MSDIPWQRRWDPLREFQREVGRIFETLEPWSHLRLARPFPAINLFDGGDRYILNVLLPGVNAEDVELTITGDVLTLRGDRKRPDGVPDELYRRQERPFGRWSRTISLPDRVDSDQVSAHFCDGVLNVNLPKLDSAKPRQINVTSGTR